MKQNLLIIIGLIMALVPSKGMRAQSFSAESPSGHILYYSVISGTQSVIVYGSNNMSGELIIPDEVTDSITNNTYVVASIGDYAFEGLINLTSVTIGRGITYIGQHAFDNCNGLTSVVFNADSCTTHAGNQQLKSCFSQSNITSFTFGNHVRVIPRCLCWDLSGLTSVTIPDSVTSIGELAFANSGLTSITIPENVSSIGSSAFACPNLTTVNYNAIEAVYRSNSGSSKPGGPFYYIREIPINTKSEPTYYDSIISPITTLTIGNSVQSIPDKLMYGNSSLNTITIPNSVTNIGNSAFYGCTGLASIFFSENIDTIGSKAFADCPITTLTIPENVE